MDTHLRTKGNTLGILIFFFFSLREKATNYIQRNFDLLVLHFLRICENTLRIETEDRKESE